MTVRRVLSWLRRHRPTSQHEVSKEIAEASRRRLDQQVSQVHDQSVRVIAKAREERIRSDRIIAMAEKAVRSLRKVEG